MLWKTRLAQLALFVAMVSCILILSDMNRGGHLVSNWELTAFLFYCQYAANPATAVWFLPLTFILSLSGICFFIGIARKPL